MKAKAVVFREASRPALEEVVLPELGAGKVLVKIHYSGVSIGTEFALIRNKRSWGPYPLCTGYQATGVIEQVGREVVGFAPGDPVYVRGGDQMTLRDGADVVFECTGLPSCVNPVTGDGGTDGGYRSRN